MIENVQRRTFPATIKSLDGAPTQAELDTRLFEMVKKWCGVDATVPAPEPAVSTDVELRDQAKALGIPVPPPRPGTAEWFRDDMLRLLTSRR